ncbi:unnamed protein product [Parnassius apollo]|uniref:(apollo) hypothetical protein n=1 Tax=Parnassius apollo TaxID=110799 RepID=A0A8S3Y0S7_PARAO|nr:unnamed protein product [Parnassius apollo]
MRHKARFIYDPGRSASDPEQLESMVCTHSSGDEDTIDLNTPITSPINQKTSKFAADAPRLILSNWRSCGCSASDPEQLESMVCTHSSGDEDMIDLNTPTTSPINQKTSKFAADVSSSDPEKLESMVCTHSSGDEDTIDLNIPTTYPINQKTSKFAADAPRLILSNWRARCAHTAAGMRTRST